MLNPKLLSVLCITFDDHSEGGDELREFQVYGRLVKKTKVCLTIQSWCYPDSTVADSNVVQFNIARKAIKSITLLKPA